VTYLAQPHARCLQTDIPIPKESTSTVNTCAETVLEPESTTPCHGTVAAELVVVTVIWYVLVRKSACSRITWVPGYMHPVVGCLAFDNKPTVLGIVPAAVITFLYVKPKLVATARCQLMKQVVADPEVAIRVVKSDFILRPRTVEEVDEPSSIDFLLDQHRKTVGYTTDNTRLSENCIIGRNRGLTRPSVCANLLCVPKISDAFCSFK